MLKTIIYNEKHYKSNNACKKCGSTWKYVSSNGCVDCGINNKNDKRKNDNRYNLREYARDRAKSKGIDFNITIDDIVIPDKCPVLGITMNRNKAGNNIYNSPSIDRIDNNKGYTKDNITIISHRANTLKNNSTVEELEMLVYYLEYGKSHPNMKTINTRNTQY